MQIRMTRRIDDLGRLVIPADLRKQYGIKAGDTVCFSASDEGIVISPEKSPARRAEKSYSLPR